MNDEGTDRSGRTATRGPGRSGDATVVIACLVATAFKFWLVGRNEIVAVPYDAWSYVQLAATDAPWATLGTLPGYPLWLWACHAFGIPQRLAIECLLAGSSAVLAWGVGRPLAGRTGFAVVYAITLLAPATFYLFDLSLSDGFHACLTVAIAGIVGGLLLSRRPIAPLVLFLSLGVVLGVMEITRRETPVTWFLLVTLSIALTWKAHRTHRTLGKSLRSVLPRLALAVVVFVSCPLAILAAHEEGEGVWSLSATDIPSHMGLLKRLASIDVPGPPQRFVPISRAAREAAYAGSPTLARLRPVVESPDNVYQKATKTATGLDGEVAAGWIWHVFGSAAYGIGIVKPAELDVFYRQVNVELDRAFDAGTMRRHTVIQPLIGPSVATWLPFLPSSLVRVAHQAVTPIGPVDDPGFDRALFDRVTLRRLSLVTVEPARIKGWAFASPDAALTVEVVATNGGGDPGASRTTTRYPRPDVRDGYGRQGIAAPLMSGFLAELPPSTDETLRLRFVLGDGATGVSGSLRPGAVQEVAIGPGGTHVTFGIDELPRHERVERRDLQAHLLDVGMRLYASRLTWLLLGVATIGCLLLHAFRATRGEAWARECLLFVGVLLSWVGVRLILYAIIDAAAWQAEQRYVLSAGIVAIALAVAWTLSLVGPMDRANRLLRGAPL